MRHSHLPIIFFLFFCFLAGDSNPSVAQSPVTPIADQPAPGEVRVDLSSNGQVVTLSAGQYLSLRLPVNLSTGYNWQITGLDREFLTQLDEDTYEPLNEMIGAPAWHTLRFATLKAGTGNLRLVYTRPFEKEETPANVFSIEITSSAPTDPFSTPQRTPTDQQIKSEASHLDLFSGNNLLSLPGYYNLCELGYCTPVKNQGNCGSCWAFGTVGVFEIRLKMLTDITRDMSEQFLVSCNKHGYSCNGGWWYAHNYHVSTLGTKQTQAGAVYEVDKPYTATNGTCTVDLPHHERMLEWKFVSSAPNVDAIKQAIYTYGPVGASVCVGNEFQKYKGGIFQTNESSVCGGTGTNHAIVLVGWNDTEGVWYLRNSWGASWGESIVNGEQKGYMRIKYGTSNVGVSANYVNLSLLESPILHSALPLSDTQIHLVWQDRSSSETGFEIERSLAQKNTWSKIGQTSANTTQFTDTTAVCRTVYEYRVRAFNESLWSAPSQKAAAATCMNSFTFLPALAR